MHQKRDKTPEIIMVFKTESSVELRISQREPLRIDGYNKARTLADKRKIILRDLQRKGKVLKVFCPKFAY